MCRKGKVLGLGWVKLMEKKKRNKKRVDGTAFSTAGERRAVRRQRLRWLRYRRWEVC